MASIGADADISRPFCTCALFEFMRYRVVFADHKMHDMHIKSLKSGNFTIAGRHEVNFKSNELSVTLWKTPATEFEYEA